MSISGILRLFGLALIPIGAAMAQGLAPAKDAAAPVAAAKVGIDVLKGIWVRPDGGYTIVIRGVGPGGKLDAMYFNPNQLPFAKAQASRTARRCAPSSS